MSLLLGRRVWIISLTYCLFFSCKIKTGDNEVSGLVQPKNQIQSTFYKDDFTLETSTVLYNDIRSGISKRILVGRYVDKDNLFGTVTANAYAQFTQFQTFYTFGPNPVLDSIVLLAYVGATIPGTNTVTIPYKYGELDASKLTLSIYRLTSSIADTAYTTALGASEYSTFLGNLEVVGLPANPKVPYRALLDPSLGQEFIDKADNFSSVETFQSMFKGLALINKGNNYAVLGIEDVRIRLYYHNYFALNNLQVRDSLDIYQNDILGLPIRKFTKINTDRSDSQVLANLKNDYDELSSETTKSACYIQGYTGVGTKVKFPFIDDFRSSIVGKILVDRADLVIKPDVTLDPDKLPPPFLMAYELDSNGHVQTTSTVTGLGLYLQGESSLGILGASNPLLISYDVTNQEYRIVMTSYIQALIDKNINLPNNGLLFIGTNDVRSSGSNYYYANINKLVFYNDKASSYNIKLNVHYSEYK